MLSANLPYNSGSTKALKMRPAMLMRATAAAQSVEWKMGRKWEIDEGSERASERGEFSAKEGNRRRRHKVSQSVIATATISQSALVPDHQTESDE